MKYYVDIEVVHDEAKHDTVEKVFSRVHGIMLDKKIKVAFDFPDMSKSNIGFKLRLFSSNKNELKTLVENSGIHFFKMAEMISVTEIAEVPHVDTFVSHTRTQTLCKKFGKKLEYNFFRQVQFFENKFKRDMTVSEQENLLRKLKEGRSRKLPFISYNSKSTNQRTKFVIESTIVDEQLDENSINGFGLSKDKNKGVPKF